MLDQAIVDAKALKEAAIKNAESSIIEKYSQEIREAVDTMLGKEDILAEEDMVANIPMDDSDVSDDSSGGPEQVVELNFEELEEMVDQQLAEEDGREMEDHDEVAAELASIPNAEHPDKTISSTLPIELSSLRISVSLVPAPPPLTSTAAVKGLGPDNTVTPVENL